jgi:PAS domain S-box-containing protein
MDSSAPRRITEAPTADSYSSREEAERRLGALARGAGALVALLGGVLLAVALLAAARVPPGEGGATGTSAGASLGLLLLGLALLGLGREPSQKPPGLSRRLAQLAAGTAGGLGALELMQRTLSWLPGARALEGQVGIAESLSPGHMAHPTALCFVLTGASLLLLDSAPWARLASQGLALAVAAVSLAALLSYAYGARVFFGLAPGTQMAMHSAGALGALGLATLCARPRGEVLDAVLNEGLGGVLARRLLPLVVALPLVLGGIRVWAESADVFDSRFGTVLRTVADILLSAGAVVWTATIIRGLDKARGESRALLQKAYDELDEQVRARTSELLRANAALVQERSFATAVLDTADAVVCVLDVQGRVVRFNRSAERLTGYTQDEVQKLSFAEVLLLPEELGMVMGAFEQLKQGVSPLRHENHWRTRSGATRLIAWSNTVLRNDEGQVQHIIGIGRDVTEQRLIEDALKASQARFEAFMDNSPAVAFIKDEDGRMVYINRPFEERFGRHRNVVIGKFDADLWPAETAWKLRANDRQVLDSDQLTQVEEEVPNLDGPPSTWLSLKFPLHDPSGKRFLAGFALDITDRKRAERELQSAVVQLERSNHELQNFASVASHDLQEPLRKVRAFGTRLQEECGESLSEDGRFYLERMQDAAERMSTLISDLLSFSRVATKAQPFAPVELSRAASDVLSILEVRVEELSAQVTIGPLPKIDADASQMRQLLQNLLANALKFHQPGEAPIVSVWAEVDEPEGVCRLHVRDNGIGFDEKYLDRIFNIFQRLHGRNEYEGSGVGLAICRKIAQRHGGDITARSEPGHGATFTVTLPLCQPENQS